MTVCNQVKHCILWLVITWGFMNSVVLGVHFKTEGQIIFMFYVDINNISVYEKDWLDLG